MIWSTEWVPIWIHIQRTRCHWKCVEMASLTGSALYISNWNLSQYSHTYYSILFYFYQLYSYEGSRILFPHVGRFHDPHGICQLYSTGPLDKLGINFYYSYNEGWTGKLGWSYAPGTMCRSNCSSHEYSQETLFILILFPENTIHRNTFIENTDTIHNILTNQIGTIHHSYQRQIFPIF